VVESEDITMFSWAPHREGMWTVEVLFHWFFKPCCG